MDKQTNLENAQARIAEASDQAVLADLERELLGKDGLLGQQLATRRGRSVTLG